jgi:hypothetical protein
MIRKLLIFIVVMYIAVKISGAIGYGLITLAGMIALIESCGPLKWLVTKFTTIIDLILFAGSIIATVSLGYNLSASLVVAGVGYTLVYAPYVRHRANKNKVVKNERIDITKHIDWS